MSEYNSTMKISQIKNKMRQELMNSLEKFLKQEYPNYGKVGANTFGVVVGTYYDEDNCPFDTCCEITVRAKPFYEKEEGFDKNGRYCEGINFYDLATQIDNFKKGIEL